ncbi:hypothetical protein DN402_18035 [Streptomyces sp. SW4]|nr:hypothetical protein DN402_18035 [Streptomyces sp. SW4]
MYASRAGPVRALPPGAVRASPPGPVRASPPGSAGAGPSGAFRTGRDLPVVRRRGHVVDLPHGRAGASAMMSPP